ncbi:PRA1 family protein H isoform X1 [Salvia miltiorrhiza]|uniref:PRA1 family protein H isoform X1 n=1 Tax=Salvia miltiorrhiza TaxID=226208 RepID=UPI0025AD94D1|nr:PRA1 family protein H isoform X1 [Salvia miltiorrhiza]
MPNIKLAFFPTKQHALNTKQMFDPNPLSLSVPEPEFESWLRDSGYLEIVDQRSTDLHRLSTAAKPSNSAAADSATTSISTNGVFLVSRFFSRVWTLLSLLTFNPLSKLAASDFSGDTPSWTLAFFGSSESYSFPSSRSQARLRVRENVKRFARNYTTLFVLFFACSLYQLPIALFGLLSCLALWDAFKLSGDRWGLDRYPLLRQALIRTAQCCELICLLRIFFASMAYLNKKLDGYIMFLFTISIPSIVQKILQDNVGVHPPLGFTNL